MKKRLKYVAVGLLLMGFGFVVGFFSHDPIFELYWQYRQYKMAEKHVDKPAPNISSSKIDGTPWELSAGKGKVLLLDFWATWCGPCVKKLPELKKLHEKYGARDDFQMVGISLDHEKTAVSNMVESEKIKWMQLFPGKDNSVTTDYSITGIPSIWIIDKQGIVRGVNLHSNEEIEEILEKFL